MVMEGSDNCLNKHLGHKNDIFIYLYILIFIGISEQTKGVNVY